MGGMSPIGTSHGDLTFENIIVFNDELYLIDFLDGYVQTPLVDISKLYQELYLNWSSRDSQSPFIVNVRNHQLKKVLDDFVIEMGYDKMTIRLHIVITMLRILPYAKNNSIYYRVLNKIFQIINL
jgi:thiamine kinase-like enzyme